jgi:hypothetical protein
VKSVYVDINDFKRIFQKIWNKTNALKYLAAATKGNNYLSRKIYILLFRSYFKKGLSLS